MRDLGAQCRSRLGTHRRDCPGFDYMRPLQVKTELTDLPDERTLLGPSFRKLLHDSFIIRTEQGVNLNFASSRHPSPGNFSLFIAEFR
jgi:hypothetical protein